MVPRPLVVLLLLSAAAQAQVLPAREYLAGQVPSSLTAGDMDGDGAADLLTGGQDLGVLLRAPDGGFLPPTSYPAVGSQARNVLLGHLDADGDLDVVYARSSPPNKNLSVRLGDGQGGLGVELTQTLDHTPNDVALGDLDGDGDDDAVFVSESQDVLDVLSSDGAGGLLLMSTLVTGDQPENVVAGDLDGDGHLDLATVNLWSSTVTAWLGDGNFGFTPLAAPLPTVQNAFGLLLGDVDEDGDADLITGGTLIALLLGQGGGSFAPYQPIGVTGSLLELADLDGNGLQDLVMLNGGLIVLPGGPGAAFGAGAPPVQMGGYPSDGVALLDVDADGLLDAAVGSFGGEHVTVLPGLGFGEFQSYEREELHNQVPTAFVASDLDGDLDVDVAVANSDGGWTVFGGTAVLLNDGDGQLATPVQWIFGTALDIAAGDVDGDGDRDLVSVQAEIGLRVQLGLGGGAFADGFVVPIGPHPRAIETGDLDADGDDDLVAKHLLADSTGGPVEVLLASGGGSFTPSATVKVGASAAPHVLADVNGDTVLDLVGCSDSYGAAVFAGLGTGAFAAPVVTPLPFASKQIEVGDLDIDGFPDLVVLHEVAGLDLISILTGDGSGGFAPGQVLEALDSSAGLALGDLDGDAFPELLSSGGAPAGLTLRYDNDGAGGLQPAAAHAAAYFPLDVSVFDLDGDERQDVVVLNNSSLFKEDEGELTLLRNLGPDEPWSWLGQGKAGAAGIPMLVGHGTLLLGEPVSLQLAGAAPTTSALLVLGLASAFAPLKGGVLVPQPDVLVSLATDAAGSLLLSAAWPAGVPSGLPTWYQVWIADSSASFGLAASNGVTAVAP